MTNRQWLASPDSDALPQGTGTRPLGDRKSAWAMGSGEKFPVGFLSMSLPWFCDFPDKSVGLPRHRGGKWRKKVGGVVFFSSSFWCAKWFLAKALLLRFTYRGRVLSCERRWKWLLGWSWRELSSGGEHGEVCRNVSGRAAGGRELPWKCWLAGRGLGERWVCPGSFLGTESWPGRCSGALSKCHREEGLDEGSSTALSSPLHRQVFFPPANANN